MDDTGQPFIMCPFCVSHQSAREHQGVPFLHCCMGETPGYLQNYCMAAYGLWPASKSRRPRNSRQSSTTTIPGIYIQSWRQGEVGVDGSYKEYLESESVLTLTLTLTVTLSLSKYSLHEPSSVCIHTYFQKRQGVQVRSSFSCYRVLEVTSGDITHSSPFSHWKCNKIWTQSNP